MYSIESVLESIKYIFNIEPFEKFKLKHFYNENQNMFLDKLFFISDDAKITDCETGENFPELFFSLLSGKYEVVKLKEE